MKKIISKLRFVYAIFKCRNVVNFNNYLKLIFNKENYTTLTLKNNKQITIRSKEVDDLIVAEYVFVKKYHIPPFEIGLNPTIVDLGTNIGLTVIDYSDTYPNSTIIGVEMDKENFKLALMNTKNLKNVSILNNAIWFEESKVKYSLNVKNDAYSISNEKSLEMDNVYEEIQAITINDLLASNGISKVDFMKIDIEGAEIEVFEKGELSWLEKVNSLHIEIHSRSKFEGIIEILKKYNFEIIPDKNHWSALFAKKLTS